MPKIIQLKDNNSDNIYVSNIIKQVKGLNIKTGGNITDALIKKAKQLVIYYTIHNENYIKNFIIPNWTTQWFWDEANGNVIYVRIDWENGIIYLSDYCNGNLSVIGYDIII